MKWRGRTQSGNVEDRRGMSPRMAMGGGGGLLAVLIVLAMQYFGTPPELQQIVGQVAQDLQQGQQPGLVAESEGIHDESREFVAVVLNDTETVWTRLFESQLSGIRYRAPRLVMFSESVNSGCGFASAEVGPFYCPADQKIFLDPTFFDDLATRHQASGDFARAYVIAHEVAHHVQNLVGYSRVSEDARRSGDPIAANQMSVRIELQADFLAGVWAHHAHREFDVLDPGDLEEAIRAANQIGDDTLQREATGRVMPERYTHGTSAQRARWFRRGFDSGKLKDGEILLREDYRSL